MRASGSKHRDRIAQARCTKRGVIAFDHAIFFKCPHPAQTGRRCEAHARGEIDIGHPAIHLQLCENLTVYIVK